MCQPVCKPKAVGQGIVKRAKVGQKGRVIYVTEEYIKFIMYVQIQTFDNQLPVIYLAIRHLSEDLKHLIPRNGPPVLQG